MGKLPGRTVQHCVFLTQNLARTWRNQLWNKSPPRTQCPSRSCRDLNHVDIRTAELARAWTVVVQSPFLEGSPGQGDSTGRLHCSPASSPALRKPVRVPIVSRLERDTQGFEPFQLFPSFLGFPQ
jgi:hypothetical protein